MNERVKQVLDDYCRNHGYQLCESPSDFEELMTGAKQLHTEITESHRWYDTTWNVADFDGTPVGYEWVHITGDSSASDMGIEMDLISICLVEKKQKTVDYYEPIQAL